MKKFFKSKLYHNCKIKSQIKKLSTKKNVLIMKPWNRTETEILQTIF